MLRQEVLGQERAFVETQGTFTPPPGSISVRFVRGYDQWSHVPREFAQPTLTHRFAVVQETYVEGCADMFFDEPLWRALAEFVRVKNSGAVLVLRENQEREPVGLDAFFEELDAAEPDEKEPPPIIQSVAEGVVLMQMVTTYWTRAGGPDLYHDSYTYSLYSGRDISAELTAFLSDAAGHERWTLPSEVVEASSTPNVPELPAWRRFLNWLVGS